MVTPSRPKHAARYSETEYRAVLAQLPDVPFRTEAIRRAMDVTQLAEGRGHSWLVASGFRLRLLKRGDLAVASRNGRQTWLYKTGHVRQPTPSTPTFPLILLTVRVELLRSGWKSIKRDVEIREVELAAETVSDRLRPLVMEAITEYRQRPQRS